MLFESKVELLKGEGFRSDWDTNIVKNEPMFFNCDLDFAYKNGGPITRDFIERLPSSWINCNPVLDSRVHMLMVGWYPCIPGYHHDDVPRSTKTGQPNYKNPEYHANHLIGLVNSEICPTKFLVGKAYMSEPDPNILQYKKWHSELEEMSHLEEVYIPSGVYAEFDCHAFHTGTKAVKSGWRWFARLSKDTDRQKNITNEIRRQVQVYLEDPIEGW